MSLAWPVGRRAVGQNKRDICLAARDSRQTECVQARVIGATADLAVVFVEAEIWDLISKFSGE